ncbi:phytanoyl-CoA dioxygenase family protein [Nocardiopsis gilva]|uniref:phytanoyl-CoA dioxygenase family protein n=1 Tax=Nocardiopsis gilva TaxID=280236 RepID=UPI0003464F00|nr:phytanoyl-CoA dioxygenase family protein [Nocardiopsis gilva]
MRVERHPSTALLESDITEYREEGVVCVPRLLSGESLIHAREAAWEAYRYEAEPWWDERGMTVLQGAGDWHSDRTLRDLVLGPLGEAAAALVGGRVRLFTGGFLFLEPHRDTPTVRHSDAPYDPYDATETITAWIALSDIPEERGCLSCLPRSHRDRGLVPILRGPSVTLPLAAGDGVFHNGRTVRWAGGNTTEEPRIVVFARYMAADAIYNGRPDAITDPLGLTVGHPLGGAHFPLITGALHD